jgi:hypothetical protein
LTWRRGSWRRGSWRRGSGLQSIRKQSIRERHYDTVGVADGMNTVADELQYFVEDEAFGCEQVAAGHSSCDAPVSYLRVKAGESQQSAHGFPASNRFENAVSVRQGRIEVRSGLVFSAMGWTTGFGCRCWPLPSG